MEKLLDLYTDYLMTASGKTTCTNLSSVLNNSISHDKFTRMLSSDALDSKYLWQQSKVYVRELSHSGNLKVLVIDDSIEEKKWTDENEMNSWHSDHSKQRTLKGVNFISSLLVTGDVVMPVGIDFVKKDIMFTDAKTGKQERKSSKSKNEIFREMVMNASESMAIDYVTADSRYGSAENMKTVQGAGLHFVMAIKSNRRTASAKEAKFAGQYLGIGSLEVKDEPQKVWLKDLDFPLLLHKQIFKDGDDAVGEIYLVSNDLSLSAEQMTTIYKKRWKAEEYHKSVKQNAAFGKSPPRTVTTQTNHFIASVLAFMKYEVLKLRHNTNHFALKTKIMIEANKNKAAMAFLHKLSNKIINAA